MKEFTCNLNLKLDLSNVIEELTEILHSINMIQRKQDKHMAKQDYERAMEITEQLLDMIQIDNWLWSNSKTKKDIHDIMNDIEDDIEIIRDVYEIKNFMDEHNDIFKGMIFNWMGADEFQQYCEKRYPQVKWHTEIIEKTYIIDIKENNNG